MPRRLTHLRTMKRAWRVLLQCSLLFVLPAFFAGAQEVKPTGEQISMKCKGKHCLQGQLILQSVS